MRKKSHIVIGNHIGRKILNNKHKMSFCVGNILPDLLPSFIAKRHEIEGRFHETERAVGKLIKSRTSGVLFNVRLGCVIHYLTDYFTLPHNSFYKGSIKDHCIYEGELKHRLREYVKGKEQSVMSFLEIHSYESLIDFIKEKHKEYTEGVRGIELDCAFIYEIACQVVYTLKRLQEVAYGRVVRPALISN